MKNTKVTVRIVGQTGVAYICHILRFDGEDELRIRVTPEEPCNWEYNSCQDEYSIPVYFLIATFDIASSFEGITEYHILSTLRNMDSLLNVSGG